MQFGLYETDMAHIISVLEQFDEVEQAVIFGSRAKGNYKAGSDIDIAVFGEKVSVATIARLKFQLQEEGPLPYLFDIVDYSHTTSLELKDHIDRVGKPVFSRSAEV